MAPKVPFVKFNNGQQFPIFGLGTWKSKPGEVTQAVKDAIDAGYRHIDCAHVYGNEAEVGAGIKAKIQEGVVKREDLYITSKLWNTFHRPDLVEPAIKTTLKNLGLEQLDLYLIHWPFAFKEGDALFPEKDGKTLFSDVDYVDTWKAMEQLVKKGLTKSIGISNFNHEQINRLLQSAEIKPVTNQIEVHPYLNQQKLIDFCKSKDITITAYSPLGSPDRPWAKPDDPKLTDDPKLLELAQKYKKTAAQILLRYEIQIRLRWGKSIAGAVDDDSHGPRAVAIRGATVTVAAFGHACVQRGLITIPKSVTKSRIQQNIDIFDFELSADDVKYIDTFDCNGRICAFNSAEEHKFFPFKIDY